MKLVGPITGDANVVEMPNQRLAVGYIESKLRIFQCNGPFKLLCTMGGNQTLGAAETFNPSTKAIFHFFDTTLPAKWPEFCDTVNDNSRVVSLKEYKVT